MIEADAVVLGAGPAGATAALNLAPFRRVLVLERRADATPAGVGESLPAAACRLLRDMRLVDAFLADGHLPCRLRLTTWGGPEEIAADAIRDPDGHGWHLERERFVAMLRAAALARGASTLYGAVPVALEHEEGGWRIAARHRGCSVPIRCRLLIDARGRGARPLPGTGAVRRTEGRLVCGWVAGETPLDTPASTVAEPDGWWYEAPLPGGQRLLAFHTDADLPAAADARCPVRLVARAAARGVGPVPDRAARWGFCAAHGAHLGPAAGHRWAAVGDAGIAFDPLASQGLFNALYTGLAVAEAAHRALDGRWSALTDYAESLSPIWSAYSRRLAGVYARETRWREAPFWQRRNAPYEVRRLKGVEPRRVSHVT